MFTKANTFVVLALYCGLGQTSALGDGDFYKISLAGTSKVLTVGSNQAVDGAGIIISDWNDQPNQKWLAVQAVVAGDNYLLMPQQQRWTWTFFLRNGEALRETKERHDSLPDWSLVLNGDSNGKATVQPRDSKKYQQWRSEVSSSGSNKVIIKNLQENKCLQVPGVSASSQTGFGSVTTTAPPPTTITRPGFFRRARNWFSGLFSSSSPTTTPPTTLSTTVNLSSTSTSSNITLAPCDKSDPGQQWILESINIR